VNKIPTLFLRDPANPGRVLPEVTPGCEWVMRGEGRGTRKYDGTCVLFDGAAWWARREVKPGKGAPDGWEPISEDPNTGKRMGWEPIIQSPYAKYHAEAIGSLGAGHWLTGTYELCGPKINGNPENLDDHVVIRHGAEPLTFALRPMSFLFLGGFLVGVPYEGIVWHHPDGRMAKLKGRDFA